MSDALMDLISEAVRAIRMGMKPEIENVQHAIEVMVVGMPANVRFELYRLICEGVVDVQRSQSRASLSQEEIERFSQLLWFAQAFFSTSDLPWVDAVQDVARHLIGLSAYRAAIYLLLAERRVRRRSGITDGRRVRNLIELAIALDVLGKHRLCTRLLISACGLCESGDIDDFTSELAFRLLGARKALENDLDFALQCLDRAGGYSKKLGDSPLRVHLIWVLAICRSIFVQVDDGGDCPLMLIAVDAIQKVSGDQEVSKLYETLHDLLTGLQHTPQRRLAALASDAIVRVVREFPDISASASDRLLHENNHGNALLEAGKHAEARECFAVVVQNAKRELVAHSPERRGANSGVTPGLVRVVAPFIRKKEHSQPYFITISQVIGGTEADHLQFQLAVACGGSGFAEYNLASRDTSVSTESWAKVIALFDEAEKQYLRHVRFWQACNIWPYRAVAHANIGDREAAIRDIAIALFSSRASSDSAGWSNLDGLLSANEDVRLACALAFAKLGHLHSAVLLAKLSVKVVHDRDRIWRESVGDKHVRSRSDIHHKLCMYLSFAGRYNEAEQIYRLIRAEWIASYRESSSLGMDVDEALAFTSYELEGINASRLVPILSSVSLSGMIPISAALVIVGPLTRLDSDIATAYRRKLAGRPLETAGLDKRNVPPSSAVLRYSVGENGILISLLLDEETHSATVELGFEALASLVFQIRQYCRGMIGVPQAEFFRVARWLHNVLVAPVLGRIPENTHTLYFELTKPLEGLPFEVLFDGEKYLVERYVLIQLEDAKSASDASVIERQRHGMRVSAFACHDIPGAELPGAEVELNAVFEGIAVNKRVTDWRPFLGSEATSEAFLGALSDEGRESNVVHLATHASFNPSSETLSTLLFSNGALSVKRLRQRLEESGANVDLLVMSACGTARQDVDVAGFVATLLTGGVRAILATQWETVDESAPWFFGEFYRVCSDLHSPLAVASAIRLAQLTMLGDARKMADQPAAHPVHWAPYRLVTTLQAI